MTIPAESRHRIEDLAFRLATSADTSDRHSLAGELGLALLGRYAEDGDQEALEASIGHLCHAATRAPDHPHRTRWIFHLGLAYAERGGLRRSVADQHQAINWLSVLYADSPAECPERTLALLGEFCWERHWMVRHGDDVDTSLALIEVDGLLARMERFLTAPPDPEHLSAVRMIVGYAYLERYALTDDRANLSRGSQLLTAAAIWDLPTNDRRRCQAGSELTNALRQESLIDENTDALDRAVTASLRTLDGGSPSDGTAWYLLHRYSASAAYNRFRARGVVADLELAYRCWQPILHDGMDPGSAEEYAQLLRDWDALTSPEA